MYNNKVIDKGKEIHPMLQASNLMVLLLDLTDRPIKISLIVDDLVAGGRPSAPQHQPPPQTLLARMEPIPDMSDTLLLQYADYVR